MNDKKRKSMEAIRMKERLEAIRERALAQINETDSLDKLNDIRVAFLGKKGELTEVLKGMKEVAPEDRPKVGQIVNETRQAIEEVLDKAKTELAAKKRELQLKSEVIDVTLPSKRDELGHKHPNTLALEEIQKIFIGMGYEVVDGPEVEYDYYNFEALNIPANHPAKDEQDTFYINDKIVLRTQTSPVQARVMEKGKLPIRMISPGRVYRADEVVELVANYLLSNKKHEQERQRKQKIKQIVSRQRKRQLLRELLISFLKQIIAIVFIALFPWVICKVTGDSEYYNMYLMAAPIALGMIYQLIKGNWR